MHTESTLRLHVCTDEGLSEGKGRRLEHVCRMKWQGKNVRCAVGNNNPKGALGLVHKLVRCLEELQALGKDESGIQACARGEGNDA